MNRHLRRPLRIFKRVIESCAFWIAAFNGLQAVFFAYEAVLGARAFFAHHLHAYAFGDLQSAEDAFLRTIVWLWLLHWAESDGPESAPPEGALAT